MCLYAGISSYEAGNDLLFIALHCPSALKRAALLGYPVDGDVISGPDGYKFKVI